MNGKRRDLAAVRREAENRQKRVSRAEEDGGD